MGKTCKLKDVSFQCMTKFTTNKKKIKKKINCRPATSQTENSFFCDEYHKCLQTHSKAGGAGGYGGRDGQRESSDKSVLLQCLSFFFLLSYFFLFWGQAGPCCVACGIFHVCVIFLCVCAQLCPTLCGPMDFQAHPSMGFFRQEYWSGLSCLSSGDLPDLGIEPMSSVSPEMQVEFLPLKPFLTRDQTRSSCIGSVES